MDAFSNNNDPDDISREGLWPTLRGPLRVALTRAITSLDGGVGLYDVLDDLYRACDHTEGVIERTLPPEGSFNDDTEELFEGATGRDAEHDDPSGLESPACDCFACRIERRETARLLGTGPENREPDERDEIAALSRRRRRGTAGAADAATAETAETAEGAVAGPECAATLADYIDLAIAQGAGNFSSEDVLRVANNFDDSPAVWDRISFIISAALDHGAVQGIYDVAMLTLSMTHAADYLDEIGRGEHVEEMPEDIAVNLRAAARLIRNTIEPDAQVAYAVGMSIGSYRGIRVGYQLPGAGGSNVR